MTSPRCSPRLHLTMASPYTRARMRSVSVALGWRMHGIAVLGLSSNRVTGTPWNCCEICQRDVCRSAILHFALRHHTRLNRVLDHLRCRWQQTPFIHITTDCSHSTNNDNSANVELSGSSFATVESVRTSTSHSCVLSQTGSVYAILCCRSDICMWDWHPFVRK